MKSLSLVLLMLLGVVGTPLFAQSYDPEEEIRRSLARAVEEREKLKPILPKLRAADERAKAEFLTMNNLDYQVAEILQKVRIADARNKALLTIKTGLNITAVNAPNSLFSFGMAFGLDIGSETLRNHFPGLFDTSASVELPRLGASVVLAVQRMNEVMAYTDDQVAERLKREVPELAKDRGVLYEFVSGGKLSEDLIALKRAQYILQEGVKAEQSLRLLKDLAALKRAELQGMIATVERRLQNMDWDIQGLERGANAARDSKNLSSLGKPEKVLAESRPLYDFSSAEQKIRAAYAGLKSNRYDCEGYQTASGNASNGAWNQLTALYQKMWADNCAAGANSEPCKQANAQFDATVRPEYKARIENTLNAISKEMADVAQGPAGSFWRRYQAWRNTSITIPGDWWDVKGQETRIDTRDGDDVAKAIYGFNLGWTPDAVTSRFPPTLPPLTLAAHTDPAYSMKNAIEPELEQIRLQAKNYGLMFSYADTSARSAQGAAVESVALATEVEPRLYFWGCALNRTEMTSAFVQLRRFSATYSPHATASAKRATEVQGALNAALNATQSIHGALSAERGILDTWAKGDALLPALDKAALAAGAHMSQSLSPYPLWSALKEKGILEAHVREVESSLSRLTNIQDAVKYYNQRLESGAKPVMRPDDIARFTAGLKKDGAYYITSQNEYRELYRRVASFQGTLKGQVQAMSKSIESATGKPSGIATPVLLKEGLYLAPDEIPDPTAGVFELLNRYQQAATTYHARLDPLEPWTFGAYPDMEKLLQKVRSEGASRAAGDGNAFQDWLNGINREYSRLTRELGRFSNDAPFGRLAGDVRDSLSDLSQKASDRFRANRATDGLQTLVRQLTDFLARPDGLGGKPAALDWQRKLEEASGPGSDAWEARSQPAVASLLEQARSLKSRLDSYLASGSEDMVRKFYQDFAATYQSKNLPRLLRFLSQDWQADSGSDLRDLETTLGNSFRVFESIRVIISGLSIKASGLSYEVSYSIKLVGHIQRMRKDHEETSQVTDTLILTPEGLKIQKTRGGLSWGR